jgi:signal transduction histidine kinase
MDKIIPEGIKMNEKALKNRRTISGKNFIAYNVPLKGASGEEQGTLVLVSDIGDIKAYNRSILRILLYSLVISGIFTLAIGFLMASGITKPLRKLQNHAKKVAGHIFEGSINLKTGDELEDLAESFNYMTERLKEYDEFQKEFFQNVSHDLKTPLMSIKAYAEGIKDGVFEGKEREEGIDVIIKEAGRLKNMVDDILLLSKLESVKDAYNFADIDILDVVREVWEKVEVIGKNQGKKMQLGIPQGRIMIKGDGEKLVNALLNILSNCIRHADSTVMLKVLQEAGRIKILIRDDGEGFKQEDLKRVFRRFFKGEKGDSGLGLAIAKAVIERHGGSISAANSRSGGAEFQIILGLAE